MGASCIDLADNIGDRVELVMSSVVAVFSYQFCSYYFPPRSITAVGEASTGN